MPVNLEVDKQLLAGLRNLQKLLERRQKEWLRALDQLEKRDRDLERQLKRHRGEIERLKGVERPRRSQARHTARPKRPRAGSKKRVSRREAAQPPLRDAMASLLRKEGPLKPVDIADRLLKGGYRSKSTNFVNVVRVRLSAPRFRRTATGAYALKRR